MKRKLPHLRDAVKSYMQKAERLGCHHVFWMGDSWIHRALKRYEEGHWIKDLLDALEESISRMPDKQKEELQNKFSKIIPDNAEGWKEDYRDRFLDILVEVLGWYQLERSYKGCDIEFNESPDLIVKKNGALLAAMECKNFHVSDKDRDYLKSTAKDPSGIGSRLVDDGLSRRDETNPFYTKLKSVIDKAKGQLSRVRAEKKYIFINLSLDPGASLIRNKIWNLILRPEEVSLKKEGFELIIYEKYADEESHNIP